LFEVTPLEVAYVTDAMGRLSARQIIEFYAAWGGVPRYWELAADTNSDTRGAIDHLVLDPQGALHREPDRLLLEEIPSALEVRPVLDAIGSGAHRVSEIAGRLGKPATSLARPLDRLTELGLVDRDVPFGESARSGKRSLYRIADPFTRLWFRVVAPHRARLVSSAPRVRLALLDRFWDALVASAWEDLCRHRLPWCSHPMLGDAGSWAAGARWWRRNSPEWDIVSEHTADRRLLLGEAKLDGGDLRALATEVAARPTPDLPAKYRRHEIIRAVLVPSAPRHSVIGDVAVVTLRHLMAK
jgi:DNA-binding transcriptional ArsR family regulator